MLSLGYIQACGGSDASEGLRARVIRAADGAVLDTALRLTNNLYVVSASLLSQSVASPVLALVAGDLLGDGGVHVSARNKARCDAAEALHSGPAAHLNDDDLCAAVEGGAYSWSHVTAADIRANRRFRGLCPQCVAGKLDQKAMPLSHSQPATAVGPVIYGDVHATTVRSPGGKDVSIRTICGFSGYISDTGAVSKRAIHLYAALMDLVYVRYNRYGHKVVRMVFDSDPD